jgi:hypothetical protein
VPSGVQGVGAGHNGAVNSREMRRAQRRGKRSHEFLRPFGGT